MNCWDSLKKYDVKETKKIKKKKKKENALMLKVKNMEIS